MYPPSGVEYGVHLLRSGERVIVRLLDDMDFELDQGRITYQIHNEAAEVDFEAQFLGLVFSLWLQKSGCLTLHGSAVEVDGSGFAFVGEGAAGKTTLAATLMQRGARLLTDDLLAVDASQEVLHVRPGYPQMRMTEEQLNRFWRPPSPLELFHPDGLKLRVPVGDGGFGRFADDSVPLRGIYLVDRLAGIPAPVIQRVPPAKAFVSLLRNGFTPNMTHALGWAPQLMGSLAGLVDRVDVFDLQVSSGDENLAAAADAILAPGLEQVE